MTTQRSESAPDGPFERLADMMSTAIGTPVAFALALSVIAAWALTGPFVGFSNTWQLAINSCTTIVTFLMVFLLGNATNRITENQDRMLSGIYDEQERLDTEEKLIERLIERIDARHIRPILKHLDDQDNQIESLVRQVLSAVREGERGAGA